MAIRPAARPPAEITRRLARDEPLIWWDRPRPALAARREVNVQLLFGVFFLCFSVFWMAMASQAPGFFFLFGVPFVLVGLWIVSTPLRAYWSAGSTLYGLTSRRALIITPSTIRSFPLEDIEFVDVQSLADGSGHVEFHKEAHAWNPSTQSNPWVPQKNGFIAIPEADRVANEMLQLRERRRAPTLSAAEPVQEAGE